MPKMESMPSNQIVLPVSGQELAHFILSLLGQRRTIERIYDVSVLFVRYEWVINTVNVISQRVLQNKSTMVSFKCVYYYKNGKTVTVNTVEDFDAFHDNTEEQTVGIDIFLDVPHRISKYQKYRKAGYQA
jgi:uncharacterized protein YqhQ